MVKHRRLCLTISAVMTAFGGLGLMYRGIRWCWQVSKLFAAATGAVSVGIIGGADGPTAIYMTSSLHHMHWPVYLILALAGIAGLLWCRRKRKEG